MLDFDLNGQIIEILKYDINNHIFNDIMALLQTYIILVKFDKIYQT